MGLFKYYTLNDYTLNVLKENSLYFNLKSNFNDPFDLNINLTISKDKFQNLLVNHSEAIDKLTSENIMKLCYWSERLTLQKFGIFCCCKSCNDILMWSHYANNHKGICIEYTDDLINAIKDSYSPYDLAIFCGDIIYDDERKDLNNMIKDNDGTPIFKKAKCWAYEKEYRIYAFSKSIQFPCCLKVKDDYIKRIYIGCNTTVIDFLTLKKVLGDRLNAHNTVFVLLDKEGFALNERILNVYEFDNLIKNLLNFSKKNFYCKVIKKKSKIFENKKFEKDYRDKYYNLKVSDFIEYYFDCFCCLDINENNINSGNNSIWGFSLFSTEFK